jgi:hypothetical protein
MHTNSSFQTSKVIQVESFHLKNNNGFLFHYKQILKQKLMKEN